MAAEKQLPATLTRRDAIIRVSALFGGVALVGQAAMLSACSNSGDEPQPTQGYGLFSGEDVAFLDEVAETILPETDTPGAKAAGVGAFMALMVTDSYDDYDRDIFREGLLTIDAQSRELHGSDFVSAAANDRLSLLQAIDVEQFDYMQTKAAEAPAHYFRMMKELALLGYFTSEIGYTVAMRYVETPGRYDSCAPFKRGDKAWASHA